ncbi:hypothetical protein D3C74_171440 [compost metagenome]
MGKAKQRAWLYCRIDAPEDVLGRLKGQRSELTAYAGQLGMDIIGISEDMGSGLNMKRSGLHEVQATALAGRMDALLVTQASRIGRSVLELAAFTKAMGNHGVAVYSVLDGDLSRSQWAVGWSRPGEEAAQKSARLDQEELSSDGSAQQWQG